MSKKYMISTLLVLVVLCLVSNASAGITFQGNLSARNTRQQHQVNLRAGVRYTIRTRRTSGNLNFRVKIIRWTEQASTDCGAGQQFTFVPQATGQHGLRVLRCSGSGGYRVTVNP